MSQRLQVCGLPVGSLACVFIKGFRNTELHEETGSGSPDPLPGKIRFNNTTAERQQQRSIAYHKKGNPPGVSGYAETKIEGPRVQWTYI